KAQSSRVPVPLPDDPYVAVRQAQLVDTDTESDPDEAPSEAEESQPLGSRVPLKSQATRLDDEGHGLDDEDHGLDDEGCGLEGEGLGLEEDKEVVPEGQ
ncbi:hypothetical protein Tco_1288045, partial [Tanacetum coccineum]